MVEILITLSLLTIVITATFVMFRGITRAWQRGEVRAVRSQGARAMLELMGRDIASAVTGPGVVCLGIGRSGTHLKPDSAGDEFFFVTVIPHSGQTETTEVGYWLRGATHTLMRHVQEDPDFNFATADGDDEVGSAVTDLEFSYFDGAAWVAAWDATPAGPQAGRLPQAVQVTLRVADAAGQDVETIAATFMIPAAEE